MNVTTVASTSEEVGGSNPLAPTDDTMRWLRLHERSAGERRSVFAFGLRLESAPNAIVEFTDTLVPSWLRKSQLRTTPPDWSLNIRGWDRRFDSIGLFELEVATIRRSTQDRDRDQEPTDGRGVSICIELVGHDFAA
jgi:hypothetical protein